MVDVARQLGRGAGLCLASYAHVIDEFEGATRQDAESVCGRDRGVSGFQKASVLRRRIGRALNRHSPPVDESGVVAQGDSTVDAGTAGRGVGKPDSVCCCSAALPARPAPQPTLDDKVGNEP